MNGMTELYQVVRSRQNQKEEGSYTCYLFEQGLDKILKKCGEESAEVLIAAKNGVKEDTIGEIGDLFYHLTVLMVAQGITLEEIDTLIQKRSEKIGNLKQFHQVDRQS